MTASREFDTIVLSDTNSQMTGIRAGFREGRSGRRLVVEVGSFVLPLQGLTPFLPMPATGDITRRAASWLRPRPMRGFGSDQAATLECGGRCGSADSHGA